MIFKLLEQFQLYETKEETYSAEERKKILASFRKKLNREMEKGTGKIVNFLDNINNS